MPCSRERRIRSLASSVQRWAIALPGQVDDRVAAGQVLGGGGARVGIPRAGGDAELGARPLRAPGQDGDLVAAALELGDETTADEAGGSGDGDAHRLRYEPARGRDHRN